MVIEPHYWPGGLSGGDPVSVIDGMRNLLARGPKVLVVVIEVTWRN